MDLLTRRQIERAARRELNVFPSVFETEDGRPWVSDEASGRIWWAHKGRDAWEWTFEEVYS